MFPKLKTFLLYFIYNICAAAEWEKVAAEGKREQGKSNDSSEEKEGESDESERTDQFIGAIMPFLLQQQ